MSRTYEEIVAQDRLWRSTIARREFEEATHRSPIVTAGQPGWVEQRDQGLIEDYHAAFAEWSLAKVRGASK